MTIVFDAFLVAGSHFLGIKSDTEGVGSLEHMGKMNHVRYTK